MKTVRTLLLCLLALASPLRAQRVNVTAAPATGELATPANFWTANAAAIAAAAPPTWGALPGATSDPTDGRLLSLSVGTYLTDNHSMSFEADDGILSLKSSLAGPASELSPYGLSLLDEEDGYAQIFGSGVASNGVIVLWPNQSGRLLTDARIISTNNGLTGGGDLTANRTFGLTGQALALHNLATSGLIARTGAGTVAGRTITGTANQITVSNGNGVSGNPTLSIPSNPILPGNPSTAGSFTSASLIAGSAVTNTPVANFGNTSLIPNVTSDGATGMLNVYAGSIFGARIHSAESNGVTVSSVNGQAAKFIQTGTAQTSVIPVVRIWRGNGHAGTTSALIELSDSQAVANGGPILRARKNGTTTVFAIDNSGRPVLRAPDGGYWRLDVSNTGVLSTTSVSAP